MQLSEETKEILKNFQSVNNSIYFKGGSTISTISVTNNIFAKAEINEAVSYTHLRAHGDRG